MKIVHEPQAMQALAEELRVQGRRIALVPTMGYLHEGHLSLMREGRNRTDSLVVSVFVNPKQFGPQEDLDAYPQNFDRDRQCMQEAGVDVVFHPTEKEMYPEGYQTYVTVDKVTRNLCGRWKPEQKAGGLLWFFIRRRSRRCSATHITARGSTVTCT